MVQVLAVTDYIDSLAVAEQEFGIHHNDDPSFFTEWWQDLSELSQSDRQRLDLIKQQYLYQRQYGHLLGSVLKDGEV